MRPQYSLAVPELPYLLRSAPLGDPLLGRLCSEAGILRPVQYVDGWSLHSQIRNSWIQLERGLLHISNLLLSFANVPAATSIGSFNHWPEPSECGYTRAHRTEHTATVSIRKSREAFLVLAARSSLAIAVWLPASPALTSDQPPAWAVFLSQQSVPSSWIDALRSSVIADFSHGLRVGAFIDPQCCPWLPHVPILRRARVPLFVKW
ncbi:hypothetical protein C8Q76DRAFT_612063, partial [Earliella scabrosa]